VSWPSLITCGQALADVRQTKYFVYDISALFVFNTPKHVSYYYQLIISYNELLIYLNKLTVNHFLSGVTKH